MRDATMLSGTTLAEKLIEMAETLVRPSEETDKVLRQAAALLKAPVDLFIKDATISQYGKLSDGSIIHRVKGSEIVD
jgi:hypothetical protein